MAHIPPVTVQQLADIVNGELWGRRRGRYAVRQVYYDTRRISDGRDGLFVALQGRQDGHAYVEEAFRKGVRAFLVSDRDCVRRLPAHVQTRSAFIIVADTLAALQRWAAHHRSGFTGQVIGITGSNGKTIVKEWLYHLIAPFRATYRSPGSYNSQLGVPLSVLPLRPDHAIALIEAGISKPGEMAALAAIVQPTGGIFTTLGSAHDAHFADRAQKLAEKLRLFQRASWLVFRADRPYSEAVKRFVQARDITPVSWAVHGRAQYQVELASEGQGTAATLISPAGDEEQFLLPLRHAHQIENALHAMVAAHHLGFSFEDIRRMVPTLPPVRMRLEVEHGVHDNLIVNDAYNADLDSLRAAVAFTQAYAAERPAILVLSDFEESRPDLTALIDTLRPIDWEHLYYVGTLPAPSFPWPTTQCPDTAALIEVLERRPLPERRVWLLKGARRFHFEKVASLLRRRSHQTRMEINLSALAHNFYLYRSLLPKGTGIVLMVKAFSYGSGVGQLTRLLNDLPAAYLAVAYTDEGVALREAGVKHPIMVMHVQEPQVSLLAPYHLEPVLYTFSLWEVLAREGYAGPVHIKVDTGMRRMGFDLKDLDRVAKMMTQQPHIHVASVFTHLAAAEDPAHDAFTRTQLAQFDRWARALREQTGRTFLRHALNSAGMVRFGRDYRYEMVRLGIGLLGIDPTGRIQPRLEPVVSMKTTVLQLRSVAPDDTIGYGRRGRRERPGTIAVIGAGYADGYRRILSEGRGKVNINDRLYPTIGTISMDVAAVDVSGGDVSVGDEVTLFGELPSLDEVARWMGTIPYEVLVSIPERVRRVYYRDAL